MGRAGGGGGGWETCGWRRAGAAGCREGIAPFGSDKQAWAAVEWGAATAAAAAVVMVVVVVVAAAVTVGAGHYGIGQLSARNATHLRYAQFDANQPWCGGGGGGGGGDGGGRAA